MSRSNQRGAGFASSPDSMRVKRPGPMPPGRPAISAPISAPLRRRPPSLRMRRALRQPGAVNHLVDAWTYEHTMTA